MIADPELEHQIQLKQLDNSHVYVTCNCLVRAYNTAHRSDRRKRGRVHGELATASLGDFPVGTEVPQLLAAYNAHLTVG